MFNRVLGRVSNDSFHLTAVTSLLAMFTLGGMSLYAASTDRKNPPVDPIVGNSGLKLSQPEMLREFEAASQQEYTLGAGDEIDVQVPSQTDLQGHQVVGPDGSGDAALDWFPKGWGPDARSRGTGNDQGLEEILFNH